MVTAESICRVLRIKYERALGSAFTIEQNGKQYVITAKHIFEDAGYPNRANIELLLDNGYSSFPANIYYHDIQTVDIAVLSLDGRCHVTPIYNNPIGTNGLMLGQDVYFLGFPLNYEQLSIPLPGRGIPTPIVKKAIVSAMYKDEYGASWLLLDGMNNAGFSGGLICAKIPGNSSMSILGVVCNYRCELLPLYDSNGVKTPYFIKGNSGIIAGCDINHALQIIEKQCKA